MLQDLGELNMSHSPQQGPKKPDNSNIFIRLNNMVGEDLTVIESMNKNNYIKTTTKIFN